MHHGPVFNRRGKASWLLPLTVLSWIFLLTLLQPAARPIVHAWDWVPADEEIQKYRKSWNPMANGPILISGVDIQPKGQFLFQPFVFGQIGHEQFGNQLSPRSSDSPTHLRAVAPTGIFAYGISNHVELNVAFSGISWEASKANSMGGRTVDSESGIGDTTIYLKYRPIVQDPERGTA
jgi:hypothetical protein